MVVYLEITAAAVFNLIAIYFLKKTDGFTHIWPIIEYAVPIILSGWLLSRAMASGMYLGIAMTFMGIAVTSGSILMGMFAFQENLSTQKLIGLGVAIIGIAVASLAKA